MFDIDKWIEDRKREEEIRCPYCDNLYDPFEMEDESLVTLYGSEYGEYEEIECPSCGRIFIVEETVRHTYEVRKRNCSSA